METEWSGQDGKVRKGLKGKGEEGEWKRKTKKWYREEGEGME